MRGLPNRARYTWTSGLVAALLLAVVVVAAWSRHRTGHPAPVSAQVSARPSTGESAAAAESSRVAARPNQSLLVTVQVRADGTLLVAEQLTDTAAPTGPVVFASPVLVDGPGVPSGQAAHPSVSDLVASYDGQTVAALASGSQRWSIMPTTQNGPLQVDLRYAVSGAAVRSNPAPAGRAIVVITPMLLGEVTVGRVQVSVTSTSPAMVLGLDCPRAAAALIVCGEQVGPTWQATFGPGVTGDAQLLTAQVDLQP